MESGRVGFAALLALCVIASGCSTAPDSPKPTSSTSESSPSSTSTESTMGPIGDPPLQTHGGIKWNDCFGMDSLLTGPTPVMPTGSEVPPGWEQPVDSI